MSPIAFKLLDNEFKMDELQRIYELIHEKKYDRRNFMRKMEASCFCQQKTEDNRVCNTMLPDDMDEVASQRTLYVYSFDENPIPSHRTVP